MSLPVPWGESTLRLDDGNDLLLPNTLRTLSHSQIIVSFKRLAAEEGKSNLLFSDSTMYKLLSLIPAKAKCATSCLNKFMADSSNVCNLINYKIKTINNLGLR